MTVHILIINLNCFELTTECIRSILNSSYQDIQIHLLDNGSKPSQVGDFENNFCVRRGAINRAPTNAKIHLYRSEPNLGFAGGNNLMLEKIIPQAGQDDLILFLNNDAVIAPDTIIKMSAAIDRTAQKEMMAARMMRYHDRTQVDNLGIGIYLTGISFNRREHRRETPLLAPCGGCALYTVNCLKVIREKTGHYYDPDFFCYAEDIDLAWRGILLGFRPVYVDDAVAYHRGGSTTGGQFNTFVMFHTVRNTLFTLVKNMTSGLFLRYGFSIILFQAAMFFRFLMGFRIGTLIKSYASFLYHLPQMLEHRRTIQKNRSISDKELSSFFTKSIYQHGYIKSLFKQKKSAQIDL